MKRAHVDHADGRGHDGRVSSNAPDRPGPRDVSVPELDELVTGFAKHLGLHLSQVSSDLVEGTWSADTHLADESGLLHRGAHSSVIETLASIGAAVWMGDRGQVVGVNNNTDFFGTDADQTTLVSTATPVHRDHDQQLWQVDTVAAGGEIVARGQVRLQNLYPR
jgi:uncharacterized protein (TIGR00369 family)